MKKAYTKTGRVCRVTFGLPPEVKAKKATLCGEFNDWDEKSHPMKKLKSGGFTLTVSLEPGRQYRYRYLLDGKRWENDWSADAYVPNSMGSDDSVIEV